MQVKQRHLINMTETSDDDLQQRREIEVSVPQAGSRLDRFLVEAFPEFSRSRLQTWMKQGRVLVNGVAVEKGNAKVRGKDVVQLSPGVIDHMHALKPESVDFAVVGEGADYWVIDKPAGLVVHPAPGHWSGTLANGLLHMDEGLIDVPRAGIVHRLDRDTTGLMVVARTGVAQAKLIKMLQARIVKRVYLALVWGRINKPVTVNKPLGRDPRSRLRMAVVDFGKPAVTHFTPVAHGNLNDIPVTLMVCRLETGRTHQIRVHAQHAGFALVADPVYKLRGAGSQSAAAAMQTVAGKDGESFEFNRQALHATHLSFPPPTDFELRQPGQSLKQWEAQLADMHWSEFIAPAPDDMYQLGKAAGIDLHSFELEDAIVEAAKAHQASALVLPSLMSAEDEEDLEDFSDDDFDVEVVQVREDE